VVTGLVREQLKRGALVRLRVAGDSMAPLIEAGDVVLVQRVNAEELRRGDLLVVEEAGSFLVHRAVAISSNRLRTKGDNVRYADPAVTVHDVLGRVAMVEKAGGRIDLYAGQWPVVNRVLGLLGWCEMRTFAAASIVGRKLLSGRYTRGGSSLSGLLATPFRLLTRLLLLR
jgi:signal peptidase I